MMWCPVYCMVVFCSRWIRASLYFTRRLIRLLSRSDPRFKHSYKSTHTHIWARSAQHRVLAHAVANTQTRTQKHTCTPHRHIHASHSAQNKCIETIMCFVRKQTEHRETKTDSMKTETPTTVSKRTLCWSRHIEVRCNVLIYCQWDLSIYVHIHNYIICLFGWFFLFRKVVAIYFSDPVISRKCYANFSDIGIRFMTSKIANIIRLIRTKKKREKESREKQNTQNDGINILIKDTANLNCD